MVWDFGRSSGQQDVARRSAFWYCSAPQDRWPWLPPSRRSSAAEPSTSRFFGSVGRLAEVRRSPVLAQCSDSEPRCTAAELPPVAHLLRIGGQFNDVAVSSPVGEKEDGGHPVAAGPGRGPSGSGRA